MVAKKTVKKPAKKVTKKTASRPRYTRPHYRLARVGIVTAIVGGILKLTSVTGTFPYPSDIIANVVIFCAIIGIAIDFTKGGLMD